MSNDPASGIVFTPGQINGLTLRNRLIRSAAFEGMCPGHLPGPELVEHHRRMAAGGVGLTTVAYASVSYDGLTYAHQICMREPGIGPALRRLTDAVHAEGAAASIQLGHAGYFAAARVIGQSDLRIVTSHLLPNALGPLTVLATFGVASAILLEAGLSFLGLGVRPPVPSWGAMINAAQSPTVLIDLPWLWIPPGLAIALTVLSVNFIGDGLRDALDPRATRRA